jgi:hypothetical protein
MALVRIRYKGLSDVRSISVKDAEKHGVKLSDDLVWDNVGEANGGKISGVKRPKHANAARGIVVDGLSDELLQVLKDEGTFTITEVKDDNTDGDDIVTGSALDDTGATVKDATSGQVSTRSSGSAAPTGNTGRGSST